MNAPFTTIGVLGGGAWGTALAQAAALAGRDVTLWCRRRDQAVGIGARQENADYLPGVKLDRHIRATADMREMKRCEVVFSVAPAQHTRDVLSQLGEHLSDGAPVVMCSKGLERETHKLMSEVLSEVIPHARGAALSGPSFASEVAHGLPTAVTLACPDRSLGESLVATIGRPQFRPYLSDDIIGAEAAGAVKNVLAIACGVVEGRRLGRNAHAALITRGMAEMTRFAVKLGGKAETLQGLCGIGDLVLTCSSNESRNMSLGVALGKGQRLKHILADRRGVTEGVATAPVLSELSDRLEIEMPITKAVSALLSEQSSVDEAIEALLARPFKEETA